MKDVIFDIETNGLLDDLDTTHSLCLKDIDTNEKVSCTHHNTDCATYQPISYGLEILEQSDTIIGHNILGFDIPAIRKVYPKSLNFPALHTNKKIVDTLIYSKVVWPDVMVRDFLRSERGKDNGMPKHLRGRHGLEAWGWRLGLHKGDYAKEKKQRFIDLGYSPSDAAKKVWETWDKPMQDYCELDVEVNHELLKRIQAREFSDKSLDIETKFQMIISMMENAGFPFDMDKANALYGELSARIVDIETELSSKIKGWEIKTPFTPKVNRPALGYKKGVPTFKVKHVPFNPGSNDHIAKYLMETYAWEPKVFTEKTNKPKIDETILSSLPFEDAKLFSEYKMTQKVKAFLADGNQGWIKLVKDGRLFGRVNTMGTVTGRCSHSKPNLGQVPSSKKPFGKECRSLFTTIPGFKLVGADASGLELRCLAHYMAKYDDGDYAREVCEGDIHTVNQKAAGLPTRDDAKTFIYAMLYGAGDGKIGSIINGSAKKGKMLRGKFLNNLPAIKLVQRDINNRLKNNNTLIGLDGRQLPVRSKHSALNVLLQSAGAIIMKKATILFYYNLYKYGFLFHRDYELVGHIHDEVQVLAREDIAEKVGETAVKSIIQAGELLNFKCPLDGEYKIGNNWSETH